MNRGDHSKELFMSLLVLALLAAEEPLPTLDAFLDGDAHAPRSIDVDAQAR